MSRKPTIQHLQHIAAGHGGKCLSPAYIDRRTKLRWRCEKGHEWEAAPAGIISNGTWCPFCAGNRRHTLATMRELAVSHGGECLSTDYISLKQELKWRCKNGHEWFATAGNVYSQGTWCPQCAKYRSERLVRSIFEQLTQKPFPSARPSWLLNINGNRLELDGYNPEIQVAFEYHGHQHYRVVTHWHRSDDAFNKRLRDDQRKRDICKENGILLIEIPYVMPIAQVADYVSKIIKQQRSSLRLLPVAEVIPRDIEPAEIDKIKALARLRGGRCVSTYYVNNTTKMLWQCANGHKWAATLTSVKNGGTWCPSCAKNLPYTLADMQKLAISRGGRCLAPVYHNAMTPLNWECANGHHWHATANKILGRKSWCPVCANRVPRTLEEMQEIARQRGGECLSHAYTNTATKLSWRCHAGHQWQATPNKVKGGSWCPHCRNRHLTIDDMQAIAARHGGVCLSTRYLGNQSKLHWKCREGHEWQAVPSHIMHKNVWCPVCARNKRLTIESMHTLAQSRGGKCLSLSYKNANTHLLWQCGKGHEWRAMPSNVKKGGWCPLCANEKKRSRQRGHPKNEIG